MYSRYNDLVSIKCYSRLFLFIEEKGGDSSESNHPSMSVTRDVRRMQSDLL